MTSPGRVRPGSGRFPAGSPERVAIDQESSSEPPSRRRPAAGERARRDRGRQAPRSIGPGAGREPSIGPRDAAPDATALDPRDDAVLERARQGDAAAVKAVVDACLDPVYGICHRMLGRRDASDVAQDAVVKIISGLPNFDGRAAVTTWATRIAMNACLGHLRRERYRRHASLDAGGSGNDGAGEGGILGRIPVEARELGPAAGVQREEAIDFVRRALDSIDPAARAILVLRDLQGLDYERIADVLDIAVGTVKSRLYRARASLRERLEQLGQCPEDDEPETGDGPPKT